MHFLRLAKDPLETDWRSHRTQTSFGGRNRKCAEAFVTSGKTFDELEAELLNGQRLQGCVLPIPAPQRRVALISV